MTERISDEAVQDLIHIVMGVRERKAHFYTLGIPVAVRYTLDEQLDAIKALGSSQNVLALAYLSEITYKNTRRTYRQSYQDAIHERYHTTYPNAPRPIQDILYHERSISNGERPWPNMPADRVHPQKSQVSHIIDHAIRQLGADL